MKRTALVRGGVVLAVCGGLLHGAPPVAATAAFEQYIRALEGRLSQQHGSDDGFVAGGAAVRARQGEMVIEKLTPSRDEGLSGALLHHWRGTAFAPGAKAADFETLLRNFAAYPRYFAPQVERARVTSRDGDRVQVEMRVRQKHVITVVLDTSYDVRFGRRDEKHGYSVSRSTKISEIQAAGTGSEHVAGPDQEQGFLWRLNSYWSYEERDGGLYLQIEAVSLTRSVPRGLGWMIGPYIESIPRESLEFTLRSARDAMGKRAR